MILTLQVETKYDPGNIVSFNIDTEYNISKIGIILDARLHPNGNIVYDIIHDGGLLLGINEDMIIYALAKDQLDLLYSEYEKNRFKIS